MTLESKMDEEGTGCTDDLDGDAILVSEASKTVSQAREDPVWHEYVQQGIDRYNKHHAVSNVATIKKYRCGWPCAHGWAFVVVFR